MKLSLSVRVVEQFHSKREAGMPLAGLAELASEHGYRALCMRASQLGTHTDLDTVRVAREAVRRLGLEVSMVTGDFPIPENSDDEGPRALRNITPYLDLAAALDSDLLRVCMKTEEDIAPARRAADEAGERGMRLAHQCHTRSLFERAAESLAVIKRIGRDNFGIIYEPANLELCHESYGAEVIRAFAPHLFNVYLQNHRIQPGGETELVSWAGGPIRFDQIPMWEGGGIDFAPIMETLAKIGYEGYVTVHQAFAGVAGAQEAVSKSAEYLRSIGTFE